MLELLGKTTISEVMLIFILLFLLPIIAMMLQRLRRYEALFGDLPEPKKKGKKKKADDDDLVKPAVPFAGVDDNASDVYPYRLKNFLSPADRACLAAMREVYGSDVEIYPKVALWETVEPSEKGAGHLQRLHDKDLDFLLCDARTGKQLTSVMYNPTRGMPAGKTDEIRRICQAAEANVVFIDMNEKYDAKRLRDALGVPELDL